MVTGVGAAFVQSVLPVLLIGGLEGMGLAVAVMQAGTPTAVTSACWALESDARPALVSAAVVLSTVASVVTLTVLLAVLTMGS